MMGLVKKIGFMADEVPLKRFSKLAGGFEEPTK